MSRNAAESRIPLPRTVRPSLLPKLRCLAASKNVSPGSACKQRTKQHYGFASNDNCPSPADTNKRNLSDYSIWDAAVEDSRKSAPTTDHLTLSLSNEKLSLFRSQEELAPHPEPGASQQQQDALHLTLQTKQNSFEHDESSLGILTPDQMTDFTVALESSRTPSCDNLSRCLLSQAARHLDLVSPQERSPSLEELPLDPKPPEAPTSEAQPAVCLPPAQQQQQQHHQRRPTAVAPVKQCFVASVTSIASLEAGYQGDGENSRPASRAAEDKLAPSRQDPMTDSDFFTESDADELGRFCVPPAGRPSLDLAEEMDSSGVYSDLEQRRPEPEPEPEPEVGADGDHTTDTADTADTELSVKSQPISPRQTSLPDEPWLTLNVLSPIMLDQTVESNSSPSKAEVTVVIKCQKNQQNAATRTKANSISNKDISAPLRKYKMPKRNVMSKIKTMIESAAQKDPDTEPSEPKRAHRSQQRKTGRWDAVMNKIEANKQRGRCIKKEVKSRVLQGLAAPASAPAAPSSTASAPASAAATQAGSSARRAPGDPSLKASRRTRTNRPESNCSNQELARSSLRSSASDLSSTHSKELPKRPLRKNCIESTMQHQLSQNLTESKSSLPVDRRKTTAPPSSKPQAPQSLNAKQNNTSGNKVADRNQRPNKELANRNHHHHNHHHHLHNNINNNNNDDHDHHYQHQQKESNNNEKQQQLQQQSESRSSERRDQQVQTEDRPLEPDWSKQAEHTVQALAITVQYFTHQLQIRDLSDSRLRQRLEDMKTEWMSARSELEELRVDKLSVEETLEQQRIQHIDQLRSLGDELEQQRSEGSSLAQSLEEERRRADRLQGCLEERQREEKALLERLRISEQQHQQKQQQPQPEAKSLLTAEVESLRTVLEIRSQENGQLRAEVDLLRRELDGRDQLRLKCDSLEARCEDLSAQLRTKDEADRKLAKDNERLLATLHQLNKQNTRLTERNEELIWRLRQKIEVVSVLTNKLGPKPQQRLSKSLQPSASCSSVSCPDRHHHHHHHHHQQQQQQQHDLGLCSIKYMVEKGDSVSWTLDIGESFDDSRCCSASCIATDSGSPPTRRRSGLAPEPSPARVVRAAKSAKTDDPAWKPAYQSTPIQRRRNERSWSLSNTLTQASSSACQGAAADVAAAAAAPLQLSTDDDEDDDEEAAVVGQRPQEAGGEAMISEETSTSSSSEDESSVSSGDIP